MGFLSDLPGIGTFIGHGLNALSTWWQNKQQKDLADYQYSLALDMWNKQNEYNSPAAQMARLSQAGLNPHLVYGNGTVAGNTGSEMPKYQAPSISAYTNFGSLGAMEQVAATNQTLTARSNAAVNAATIEKIKEETLDTREKRSQNQFDLLIKEQKYIEYKYKNAYNEEDKKYWKNRLESNQQLLDAMVVKTTAESFKIDADRIKTEHEVPLVDAQTGLTLAQTDTEKLKPALVKAQTVKATADASLARTQAWYIENYQAPETQARIEVLKEEKKRYPFLNDLTKQQTDLAVWELLNLVIRTGGQVTENELKKTQLIRANMEQGSKLAVMFSWQREVINALGGSVISVAGRK